VDAVLADGEVRTPDLGGRSTTAELAEAIRSEVA
jgi:isocitrate/isopropylmalate dehydrogenase